MRNFMNGLLTYFVYWPFYFIVWVHDRACLLYFITFKIPYETGRDPKSNFTWHDRKDND